MSLLAFSLAATRQSRRNMEAILATCSLEQINVVPAGFNNNLVWNYGHVIVTQQLLTYGLSGLPIPMATEWVQSYRKGTAPDPVNPITADQYAALQALSHDLLNRFEIDLNQGIFAQFNTYSTSFNLTLTSLDEACHFNLAHEAMHLGSMLALRKLV